MVQDTYKEIREDLRKQYKKQALSLQETAKELSVSVGTLRNSMKNNQNVPEYRIMGGGSIRQKVVFPIHNVAKFLADTQKVF